MATPPPVRAKTGRSKSKARQANQLRYPVELLAHVNDAIFASDADDRLTVWNAAAEAVYGWTAEEVLGRNTLEVVQTEYPEADKARRRHAMGATGHDRGEATQVRKDGTRFLVEVNSVVLRDEHGKIAGCLSVNRDLTERRQAEQALLTSEARWQSLVTAAPVRVTLVDRQGTILFINRTSPARTIESAVGSTLYAYLSPAEQARTRQILEEIFNTGRPQMYTTPIHRPDGSTVWYENRVGPVEQKGEVTAVIFVSSDITEHKRAEEKLRDSEERYRALFEQSPDGMVILDPATTRPLEFNDQVCRQLGYTREEFSRLQLSDIEVVENVEDSQAHIQNILRAGRDDFETRHRTQQGEIRDIYVIAQVLSVGAQSVYCCIWRDITDRKRAEAERVEAEAKLRALFAAMHDVVLIIDEDGVYREIAPTNPGLLVKPAEELLGKSLADVFPSAEAAGFLIAVQEVLATQQSRQIEYQLQIGETSRWFSTMITPMSASLTVWVARDITERKQAEDALRESEERNQALLNALPDMMFVLNRQGTFVDFSSTTGSALLLPPQLFVGKNASEVLPPDIADLTLHHLQQVFETGQIQVYQYQIPIDGEPRFFESRLVLKSRDEALSIVRDITERKRAEEAMQESEERFRLTFQTSPDAININRLADGLFLDINDGFTQLTGFTRADAIGKTSLEINVWHNPADRQELVRGLREKGYYENLEAQFRRKDGSLTTALMSARVTVLHGVPCIISITRDISERKRAEARLIENEERYRLLVDASPDPVFLHQGETFIFVNPAALKLLRAASPADLLGKPILDIVQPAYRPIVIERVRQAVNEGRHLPLLEEKYLRLDGSSVDVEVVANSLMIEGQRTIQVIARDITERKQREREVEAIATVALALRAASLRADMLPIIVNQVLELLQAASVMLLTRDPVTGESVIVFGREADQDWTGRRFPPGAGIVGHVLSSGQPYVTNDVSHDPHVMPLRQIDRLQAIMCVPLIAQDRILGAVWVCAQTSFGDGELRLLTAISDIAANALHRAEVLETLEQRVSDRTRELAAANERLKSLDWLKSKFVSDVSHELRAPITALSLNVDLLERGKPEKRPYYLSVIREQVLRENKLIEDILNLSRLELGAEKVRLTPIALNGIVAQLVALHQPLAEAQNLTLTSTLDPALPEVQGEENQLAQVITNLIGNAINYTPAGEISVRTAAVEYGALLEVRDTGLGIAPADLPHLFERFYRSSRTQQIRGTGLGLAIVKEIVDLHDGRVEVDSPGVPGLGSTFRVYFPALPRPN